MKKFRLILMSLVIVLAVGGAFASSDPPCVYSQQYYKVGGTSFLPAGQLGLHYACILCPFACTYYLPDPVLQPENFVPCRQGIYIPIIL